MIICQEIEEVFSKDGKERIGSRRKREIVSLLVDRYRINVIDL